MATSAAPNERDSYPLQTTSQAADPAEVQEGGQICQATSRSQQSTRVQAYDMETAQPSHPHQWSTCRRLRISIIVCFATITASFTSAIYAAGVTQVCEKFGIKSVVADLGTTLYVLGFAFGPIIWAPVSEVIGRYWPLNVGMLGCSIFTIGSAVAHNMQTLLVTRFFAGFCAASPLSIAPAVYADIYQTLQRSVAVAIYAMAMFMAPLIAPIVGIFVANGLEWRWTLYIPAIMGFCSSLLLAAFMPETYAPIILRKRETQGHGMALKDWAQKYLTRPLRLLVAEPIVLLMSLYVSFIYALLYAFLVAYPFVFETIHHMSSSVATLPLLSLIWGELVGGLLILSQQGAYARRLAANEGIVIPEWRLPQAVIGSVAFAVGLFW
ncbi:hypothetical protein CBS147346_10691 [Aspergillus niger]|nr:hypothetical protein CBS147346_10691 [Aspergillus niger]